MSEAEKIITRILKIDKGNMIGLTCEYVLNKDKKHQILFLKECYNQLHVEAVQQKWGEALVSDIKNYVETKNRSKKNSQLKNKR